MRTLAPSVASSGPKSEMMTMMASRPKKKINGEALGLDMGVILPEMIQSRSGKTSVHVAFVLTCFSKIDFSTLIYTAADTDSRRESGQETLVKSRLGQPLKGCFAKTLAKRTDVFFLELQ